MSFRERPTSPSTAEAIQGMLSMAGLLCSSKSEKGDSLPESWWPSPREQVQHQRRLQGDKSPIDSQGNSSSEAWDNQGLPSPEMDYQYCDPSMSPPLHPSKRHAPNPPPVSNQATKGLENGLYYLCLLSQSGEAISVHTVKSAKPAWKLSMGHCVISRMWEASRKYTD